MTNASIDEYVRSMVAEIIEEKLTGINSRGDAMARLHGEYVKIGEAAKIMGVSRPTVEKLRDEGLLDYVPRVGVSVRSIAELPARTVAHKKETRARASSYRIKP